MSRERHRSVVRSPEGRDEGRCGSGGRGAAGEPRHSRDTRRKRGASMPNVSFYGLLLVAVVVSAAPLLLGLSPARRLPSVVLEIIAGIIIGSSGLGWVKVDVPTSILSLLGLAFLLFLAGLEVELNRLK